MALNDAPPISEFSPAQSPPQPVESRSAWEKFAPLLVVLLAAALFFPGLSWSGFWDPSEVHLADLARNFNNATGAGPQFGRPPLAIWLIAWGFRTFGIGELGGRLPLAVASLLAVIATYYAGTAFLRRRAALIGAFAMCTMPVVLLGARQLAPVATMHLGSALALGGFAHILFRKPERPPLFLFIDLLLGLAGLAIGQLSSGILMGVVAPLSAVALAAIALNFGVIAVAFGIGTIASLTVTLVAMHGTGYSAILGGVPHTMSHNTVFTSHLATLGFALFPWIVVAPLGALDLFYGTDGKRKAGLLVAIWFVTFYLFGTWQAAGVSELQVPVASAVALLAAMFIDPIFDQPSPLPAAGLMLAMGAALIAQDFISSPEKLISVHLSDAARWPGALVVVPNLLMAIGAFWGASIALGVGAPLASAASSDRAKLRGRRIMLGASLLSALGLAITMAFVMVPQVSKHLSARDLYGKTQKLDPNAPLGQYRFNATGSSYYAGSKKPEPLSDLDHVFQFLAKSERVFVMAGSEELPAIDQFAKQKKLDYVVADDSNSHYLILSNRLGPNEKDLNPLKRFISTEAPKPQFPAAVNFEDKLELIGYDTPTSVNRGQDFRFRLYFKVKAQLPAAYKVFIHFDGGTRFNGDHSPLEGRFPTTHWVPGYYITDEHLITPDRATQPSGVYQIFVGLFSGDKRLKVTSGPQDGENRVKLGTINVK